MNPAELIQLLVDVTGTTEVRKNPQLPMFETQLLDSMRAVELFLALDDRWGINISLTDFDRAAWATPELFVKDVEARAAAL
jgi:D-alanine--poly(phosphoribitol) ligase subunit 2